tara:strand:+ start:81 stop:1196 length:1116 start_codon:yes stop_codon:yes gene_type:complete
MNDSNRRAMWAKGGIYGKNERNNNVVPNTSRSFSSRSFSLNVPGTQGYKDNQKAKTASKNEANRTKENEKNARNKLIDQQKEFDNKQKEIINDLKKGIISEGKATQLLNQNRPVYAQRVVLPFGGKMELTQEAKEQEKILVNKIDVNERDTEELMRKKREDSDGGNLSAMGFGKSGGTKLTSQELKKLNEELEELREDKKLLDVEIIKLTGINRDTSNNRNAMVGKIEDTRIGAGFEGKDETYANSPGRATDSEIGLLPSGKETRDKDEKEARQLLQYGENITTFPQGYQKKRKDESGEYTSKLADTVAEKQLQNLHDGLLLQNYLNDMEIGANYDAGQVPDPKYNDPTDRKGMGALRTLLAERAGRGGMA